MKRFNLFQVPYRNIPAQCTACQYVRRAFPTSAPHPLHSILCTTMFLLSKLCVFVFHNIQSDSEADKFILAHVHRRRPFLSQLPCFLWRATTHSGVAHWSGTTTHLLLSGHYSNSAVGIWLHGRPLEGLNGAQVPAASPLLTFSC